jgi:hypothetical protein
MQVIYGAGNASNILLTAQKRLIRPSYAQTQGFPYSAYLDPSLRWSDGTIRDPLSTDVANTTYTSASGATSNGPAPFTRSAAAYTYQGSLIPGLVVAKTSGEYAAIHNGGTTVQPWGLLDQWVGGSFDNIGQNSQISVWMGPDSTYDLLAPAWNDTGLAAAIAATGPGGGSAGGPVYLYAGTDGRLCISTQTSSTIPVARVVERWSAARLTIQLVI